MKELHAPLDITESDRAIMREPLELTTSMSR
jgi:hypothetical protein